MPRGKLEIPAELLAHSHGRGGERGSGREGREGGHRDSREGGRESSRRAPRQPVDDFHKPYVPAAPSAAPEAEAPRAPAAGKRQLAVLLGGSRKPN